jgi:hypothetical protein
VVQKIALQINCKLGGTLWAVRIPLVINCTHFYIYLLYLRIFLRERDHWGDQDGDGRIILRWILRKLKGIVGTGWSWLRIGTGGGHLWVR